MCASAYRMHMHFVSIHNWWWNSRFELSPISWGTVRTYSNLTKARNSYFFQFTPLHPAFVRAKSACHLQAIAVTAIWKSPHTDFVKLNFHGSVNLATNYARYGGIIWNHTSNIIVNYAAQMDTNNPLQAELHRLHNITSFRISL